MIPRRRIYEFSGGILETNAYDDGPDDGTGVYLEYYGRTPDSDQANDYEQSGAEMHYKPTCLGYVRTDVSGMALLWDQSRIRRLADRLGYDFADMVIYDPKFGRPPLARLKAQATRLDAEAVIVPSPDHFEGAQIPGVLVKQLDVITVDPEETYARRAMPPLHDLPPARADEA
ncbi:Uncharacterised protein [Nocardia otitidiscaviarum]|uniref:Uncharacterized protein n=1 Tax=Nocardia otitidiscaviarum TaxID=1823 RepID=A0A378YE93_9NOCA|nr:hypothetical protein [Nocardia otitidiscaviarum]SUA75178.1 Uncharacterised protein [Nocardia otitidiscaviarum]